MATRPGKADLRVRDVFRVEESLAIIVEEATPFHDVVREFAVRADLRGIFVVDKKKRLTGVITRPDLLTWASLVLGAPGYQEHFSWKRLMRLAQAATAKDACHPYSHMAAVRPGDALLDALANMVVHNLIDVPVIDEDGTILGDLRLTQILAKALEVTVRGPRSEKRP